MLARCSELEAAAEQQERAVRDRVAAVLAG